tara:strand:+ start:108 stop:629 length:522 start_codon:yes stop_codon:yes gene_type:complete
MRFELLSSIFDAKTVSVIAALLKKKGRFYLRDLSRESGVSLATTYRIVQKLLSARVVLKDTKEKIEFYEINRSSKEFQELCGIFLESLKSPAEMFKELLSELHGTEPRVFSDKEDVNKVIVVSSLTDRSQLANITKQIEDETGLKFKTALFSSSQFIEMKNLGYINSKHLINV